jgi:hypothetical protein
VKVKKALLIGSVIFFFFTSAFKSKQVTIALTLNNCLPALHGLYLSKITEIAWFFFRPPHKLQIICLEIVHGRFLSNLYTFIVPLHPLTGTWNCVNNTVGISFLNNKIRNNFTLNIRKVQKVAARWIRKNKGQFQYCFEISCPIKVQLKTPIFWDVGYDRVRSFETSGTIYPTTKPTHPRRR